MKETGIYIHVPYCRKKCFYCDFFSGGAKNIDWKKFLSAIIVELRERRRELATTPSTLYIGGGTPSLIPSEEFIRLIENIQKEICKTDIWDEFTIEVNPEDVTEEKCKIWKEAGVTRLSMGVQSLNDKELKLIGRGHDPDTAVKALEMITHHFRNYSVDLIYGLPGQTRETWLDTVTRVTEYDAPHISAYSLMFEEKTVLTLLRKQGKLDFPSEDDCVYMWSDLSEILKIKGYRQYELSNYSKPEKESLHNRRYWLGNPYLGLGPGAHSYDGHKIRRWNEGNIKLYLERFDPVSDNKRKEIPFYNEEILSDGELIEEKIMLSLRMAEGIRLEEFKKRFGEVPYQQLIRNSFKHIENGTLIIEDNFLHLTKDGIMVSDDIILDLCL